MMVSGYLRRGRRQLEGLAMEPGVEMAWKNGLMFGTGLVTAAIGWRGSPLPVGAVLAALRPGWQSVAAALGAGLGYRLFWPGTGGLIWAALAMLAGTVLRMGTRQDFFPLAAGSVLIPALTGTLLRLSARVWAAQSLGALAAALVFSLAHPGPGTLWVYGALGVLGLRAMGATLPAAFLAGLGCGCVPGAVLLGLALEAGGQAGMGAGLPLGYLLRFAPVPLLWRQLGAPALGCLTGMALGKSWNAQVFFGVWLGGVCSVWVPTPRSTSGSTQVRLEQAARALSRMQQAMLELPVEVPTIQDGVEKLRQYACQDCPQGAGCPRKEQLDDTPFRDPLSFTCPRTGRMLREARRVREQLRLVQMQHRRLEEYRMALAQQYGMLSRYLRRVADGLPMGFGGGRARYRVAVSVRSQVKNRVDGDRCAAFPGLGPRFYVLLCDGMGTGIGAAEEAKGAVTLLRQMLTAGLPPRYAMGSLNAQLVLTGQSGFVTADLTEVRLDTGSACLYKWGAAPSWLLRGKRWERLGGASPPPGRSLSERAERVTRLSLRRGETLVMASDGVAFGTALPVQESICPTGALAENLLKTYGAQGQDDATLAVIRLEPLGKGE